MKCILYDGQIIECSKIHFNQNGTMYIECEERAIKLNSRLLVEVVK